MLWTLIDQALIVPKVMSFKDNSWYQLLYNVPNDHDQFQVEEHYLHYIRHLYQKIKTACRHFSSSQMTEG